MTDQGSRREFLETIVKGAEAISLGTALGSESCTSRGRLPQRTLGRTGVNASVLGLGLGPLGTGGYTAQEFQTVVQAALGEWGGLVVIDVQPDYGDAESHLAPVLRGRRNQIFIMTKTWEQARAGAFASVQRSVRRLGVEYVDAVLLNNIGLFDLGRLFSKDGALAGLRDAQRDGMLRYVGLSGHMGRDRFATALDSGEFDIAMPALNFVDRHTYDFEGTVLSVAHKHEVAVVAMKVLGGAAGWDYSTRAQRALLVGDDYEPALHYALGLPDVATAIVGCKSVEEVRQATDAASRFSPLHEAELARLLERGKVLAAQWGTHFGPVVAEG